MEMVSTAPRSGAVVVPDTAGHDVRIDPNTTLRLHLQDGSVSEVVDARALAVSPDGLVFHEAIGMADVTAIIVTGLDERQRELVERSVPARAKLTKLPDGSLRVDRADGDSEVLRAWATSALVALAWQVTPSESSARLGALGREPCPVVYGMLGAPQAGRGQRSVPTFEPDWWCKPNVTYAEAVAVQHVLSSNASDSLGTWSLVDGRMRTNPLHGAAIGSMFRGVEARMGWRWNDIASAEVANISGSKTLAAFVLTGALALALAPVAAANTSTGDFGGGPHGAAPNAVHAATPIPVAPDPGPAFGAVHQVSATTESELAFPSSAGERPFFSPRASRQAYARFSGSLDSGLDVTTARGASENLLVTMRLFDVFELGGGAGVIEATADGKSDVSVIGLFRGGLHAWLDEGRRFAIPLVADLGSGGDVRFHVRALTGLRLGLPKGVELSIYPLSPTWDSRRSLPSRWSLESSIGASIQFF